MLGPRRICKKKTLARGLSRTQDAFPCCPPSHRYCWHCAAPALCPQRQPRSGPGHSPYFSPSQPVLAGESQAGTGNGQRCPIGTRSQRMRWCERGHGVQWKLCRAGRESPPHLLLLQLLLLLHLQFFGFEHDRQNQNHKGGGPNPQSCPREPIKDKQP